MKKITVLIGLLLCSTMLFAQNNLTFNFDTISNETSFIALSSGPSPDANLKSKSSHNSSHSHSSGGSSFGEFLGELLFDLTIQLMIINNFSVSYDDYPYANGKYISSSAIDECEDTGKYFRGSIETGIRYYPEVSGLYSISRLEFVPYKYLALIADYTVDLGNVVSNQEPNMSFSVGGQIPLFQFNVISIFVNSSYYYSNAVNDNNYCKTGLLLRSYPVEPLLLEYRAIWTFGDDSCIYEGCFEMGFMLNSPIELFVDYSFLANEDGTTGNAFTGGVKLHF